MNNLRRSVEAAGGLHTRAGLAKRWGITRQAVSKLVRRADFPAPVLVDGKQEVWLAAEADAWRNRNRR